MFSNDIKVSTKKMYDQLHTREKKGVREESSHFIA